MTFRYGDSTLVKGKSMNPLTEENNIYDTTSDSFEFNQELTKTLESDPGIFLHDNTVYFVRTFAISRDVANRSFFDHLVDIYTPPDQLKILPLKRNFLLSHVWNVACLNKYFKKAMTQLDLFDKVPHSS